ncbi:MAG TPA: PilN domain-containing protein [Rhodopila sp.]
MLAGFISWWLARINELLPAAWTNAATRLRDGIVVHSIDDGSVTVALRRNGALSPVALGAAARQRRRKTVLLQPPAGSVLVKNHIVPTTSPRQMTQLLRHELARITPFPAEDLFWRWDGHPRAGNRTRSDVTLTMVPRKALAPVFDTLDTAGLKADFLEVGPPNQPTLIPLGQSAERDLGTRLTGVLAYTCAALAAVALLLPVALQALALYHTDSAIAELQPAVDQVESLRRAIATGDTGREILAQETKRTADVLQTLAAVTRILPDDTYLTDFSLRERQMTLSGRSASAPRLITGLSADPAIRNTAFAAPVTRIEGASADVFSIKAEVTQ